MDTYALTLSLGLFISLIYADVLMITAGGLIVPGYVAFMLHEPVMLGIMLLTSLVTYLVLLVASRVTILFGRRLFVLAILIGLVLHLSANALMAPPERLAPSLLDFSWVVPGLLALWIYRQGIVTTYAALITTSLTTAIAVIFVQQLGV